MATRPATSPAPRPPRRDERARLLDWLDDGLRRGERGRLAAEYPLSLDPMRSGAHRVVYAAGAPVAHAMWHVVQGRARGRALPIGLIGLVYTDPAWRGRGLGPACVESCAEALRRRGVPLAALWSERHDFYARLGFHPAGRESLLRVDARTCRRAQPAELPPEVGPVRRGDFPRLERLYAAKPVGAVRAAGALERLAAAPATALRVAREDGTPVAYAACGRGDDFPGVVHEWAGSAAGVVACLAALAAERGSVGLLAGPEPEAPVAALRAAGAQGGDGCFALLRVLDAGALLDAIAPAGTRLRSRSLHAAREAVLGTEALSGREVLAWLFDGVWPPGLAARLAPAERSALERVLPWPLYLWGFDSI
jgi:GNAT superfamily N-acetyltransferase